jgi:endonuclease/exonuclease/phosphatase (EEP) superfamily protein YafD
VCDVTHDVAADVVILIESSAPPFQTLDALKGRVTTSFSYPRSAAGRFQVFSRDSTLDLSEFYAGDRMSIRRLCYAGTHLLLGIVHLVDMSNWDQSHQSVQTQLLSRELRREEERAGHDRTLLVGDFNMNPFDQIMNMAEGMNAMMTKRCVQRGTRVVQNEAYPFFYNPMWGLFGDRTTAPPGTYYHTTASRGVYGWNMLDQVLVRPTAIQWFSDVSILTSAGSRSLRTQTLRPDKRVASDHFPILLALK